MALPLPFTPFLDWIDHHATLLTWLAGLSILTFVGSLVLIPWLILRIPEDYFTSAHRKTSRLHRQHPVEYFLIRLGKNLLGVTLVLAGLAMLVLPGQGILAILAGITLTDFPGKFRLERWLIERPAIYQAVNWIRRRAHRPPLRRPAPE